MRRLLFLIGLSLLAAAPAAAMAPTLPQRPALSPDGTRIAFAWRGDLWVVPTAGGRARRLTVHDAYDTRPVWSPDGKHVAFASWRFGNHDVFIMSAEGGLPRRLTYHSDSDYPTGFSADGQWIYFHSRRFRDADRRGHMYRVPVAGGTPTIVTPAAGEEPRVSPDGKRLVFQRGILRPYRKGYRGSGANQLWLYDLGSKKFTELTGGTIVHDTPSFGPGGEAVYCRSERSGKAELWRIDLKTRQATQVTKSAGEGIRRPHVAARAPVAVFERWDKLVTVDLTNGKERVVPIEVPADERTNRHVWTTWRGRGVTEFAVSPDGEAIAFVVHGEVFLKVADSPTRRAIRLTATSARERSPSWLGNHTLAFTSDRDGQEHVYTLAAKDSGPLWSAEKRTLTQLTKGALIHEWPKFSPDGRRIAYQRGIGNLIVRDLATGKEREIVKGWNLHSYRWSPDGQWIAYSRSDADYNSDIFLVPATGGDAINVSRHPDDDHSPRWSEDGRVLAFMSARGETNDVYFVYLRREDHERPAEELVAHTKDQAKAVAARRKARLARNGKPGPSKAPLARGPLPLNQIPILIQRARYAAVHGQTDEADGLLVQLEAATNLSQADAADVAALRKDLARKGRAGRVETDERLVVRVDAKEVFLRVKRIAELPGSESSVVASPEGDKFVFSGDLAGQPSLFAAAASGGAPRTLATGVGRVGGLVWGPLGKQVYFLSGGLLNSIDPGNGRRTRYDFEARVLLDTAGVRRQKFEECWRLMAERFYDPKFHGADWPKLRERYRPLAMAARSIDEFNRVISLMLGELNASHLGISGPPEFGGESERTGLIGVDLDPAHDGEGVRVQAVLPGGPADHRAVQMKAGDVILSVNDVAVTRTTSFYALLAQTSGLPTRLSVRRGKKTLSLKLRPVNTGGDRSLRYRRWVDQRRALVEGLGKGRLAYIHIAGMNWPSLEAFERDLYARAHGKDGLLIDVRYNGGGWTTDMLLVMLQTRPHAYTVGRGGRKGYPQGRRPFYVWQKSVGLLCNEASISNAEIFSHAFKTLELGPLVGWPTFGGVISTGSTTLIDGARMRLPGRGWYLLEDGKTKQPRDMEFYPAVPDHVVDQTPESEVAGRDPQLAKAAKALLEGKKK